MTFPAFRFGVEAGYGPRRGGFVTVKENAPAPTLGRVEPGQVRRPAADLWVVWPGAPSRHEGPPHAYLVAGRRVVSRRQLPALAPFQVSAAGAVEPTAGAERDDRETACFAGPVVIGGRTVQAGSFAVGDGLRLEVRGLRPFFVSGDRPLIACLEDGPDRESDLFADTFIGPVLMTALALHGTFCLHASSVRAGTRIVAFAGETGAGKSTLAQKLMEVAPALWERLTDDILPLTATDGSIAVEPRFPQLKLPGGAQLPPGDSDRHTLSALYQLVPPTAGAGGQVRSQRVGPAQAMAVVASQTVSAKLFSPGLLDAHLAFCREIAARVPVRLLTYPRSLTAVAAVSELLRSELDAPTSHDGRTA